MDGEEEHAALVRTVGLQQNQNHSVNPGHETSTVQIRVLALVLTGPMMVACQWNTENSRAELEQQLHQQNRTEQNPTEPVGFAQNRTEQNSTRQNRTIQNPTEPAGSRQNQLDLDRTEPDGTLLSSPTGPAEHWAGGSLDRSVSSCRNRTRTTGQRSKVNT